MQNLNKQRILEMLMTAFFAACFAFLQNFLIHLATDFQTLNTPVTAMLYGSAMSSVKIWRDA